MVRIAVVVQARFGIYRRLSPSIAVYRRLSPSIALKRDFSTVFLTVNLAALDNKLISFRCLQVPETIEWE